MSMMSATRNVPLTQLALKRELKPVSDITLKHCDQSTPAIMRPAEILPRKRLLYNTASPHAARRSAAQTEESSTSGSVPTKDMPRHLPSPAHSGGCLSSLLRIPCDGLSRSSGMGASTVSLLVHAPSLSRMSGQVDDEEDDFSFCTETGLTNSMVVRRNVDLNQMRHGCLVCQLGLLGKKRATNLNLLKKHVSIGAVNVFTLAEDIREVTGGYYVPALCTLHKELGWNPDSLTEAVDLYRVFSSSKNPVISVSLPDLYQAAQDSYPNDMPEEPTELNVHPTSHHVESDIGRKTSTSQEKCKNWLEDLGMT
ncbi:hypothetical protein T265_15479 [Opisthorchis viverrini]|uniref:Uncharacterized protein n=1 Tax=Opisthorchis viverrini TaxID=6198 RepID=A0A074Z8Y1_OPIVI|nr:hypothetical protein T265_15479 [Opisthorchis viverrini]KER19675.1 hypothetical protein T265_15479 [Opisthorchis viverrini]